MSGRYAYNTGMNEYNQRKLGVTEEMAGVPMSFDFIPKVLKKAGYVSHQVGKWHIGFFDHDLSRHRNQHHKEQRSFYHAELLSQSQAQLICEAGAPGCDPGSDR